MESSWERGISQFSLGFFSMDLERTRLSDSVLYLCQRSWGRVSRLSWVGVSESVRQGMDPGGGGTGGGVMGVVTGEVGGNRSANSSRHDAGRDKGLNRLFSVTTLRVSSGTGSVQRSRFGPWPREH